MRIALFIPCFVDHYFPQAGIAITRVLERLGHSVDYPAGQTCCGQPAFNAGYWDEARPLALRMLDLFASADVVVSASGSCGAMLKVFTPELLKDSGRVDDARALSGKVWEFSDFLVNKLGVTDVGATFPHRVTFHDGCHGLRELGIKSQPRQLLEKVAGLELVEMGEAESCCGFGGTFSVKFSHISEAMAEVKCHSALATGADFVVSNDSSCLMQINGWLEKNHPDAPRPRTLHLAEVLAHQSTEN
ncbi:MAG: (Fe-S)-binding protein [Verrucomicrobiae bacterium]|nr:(Fe-S)-binding protein [Verrucomicrobiae bacterium]